MWALRAVQAHLSFSSSSGLGELGPFQAIRCLLHGKLAAANNITADGRSLSYQCDLSSRLFEWMLSVQ